MLEGPVSLGEMQVHAAWRKRMNFPGITRIFKAKGLASGKAWTEGHGGRDHVASPIVSLPVLVSGIFHSLR